MIVMAGLVRLPISWLVVFSVALIALHNCLDPIAASHFGSAAWIWNLIHQPGVFVLAGKSLLTPYTLLPWIAVLTAGFCFGQVLKWEPSRRERFVRSLGLFSVMAFIVLRAINKYGDPAPWSIQKSTIFTALSFLNCTKYPASLDFLLMTLGPALLLFVYLDRHAPNPNNPLVTFGRVPLFYFILHFYLIHALAVLFGFLRYGTATFSFMFNPLPSMGGPQQLFPKNFGYSLPVAYAVWIIVVASLYPLCRWYASVKARNRSPWLSYL